MMYDLGLAWRNMRTHIVESLIPVIVIALAIGLSLTIFVLADGLQEGIILSSDPFGVLVIGPKGSPQELVTSTVLLQDEPIGLISYDIYERLHDDERVQLAVPLAFADNVGGARVIGTTLEFFELRRAANEPPAFQIAEGRLFTMETTHLDEDHADEDEHLFEAVLGSKAAEDLGLKIGESFRAQHGFGRGIAENVHFDAYMVVGILEETKTPYDAAIFTALNTVWEVHAEIEDGRPTVEGLEAESTVGTNQLTAILVLPRRFGDDGRLFQEFAQGSEAQAAYPGKELTEIYRFIDDAQELLNLIALLVLGIAAFTVFLSMYSTTVARERSIAVMRSLGSRRLSVMRVILFETLFITLLGAALGRILGYGTAYLIADVFSDRSAIPIPVIVKLDWEILLWALPLGVGMIAGLIPAVMAYRVDVVEKLFPS
jgi:putative ABC transport system permease protein